MKLDELGELECIVCLDTFHEPVTLYCGHSYCRACILAHLAKNNKCPQCKTELFNNSNLLVDQSLESLIRKIHQHPEPEVEEAAARRFTDSEVADALRLLETQASGPERVGQLLGQLRHVTRPSAERRVAHCVSYSLRHKRVVPVNRVTFETTTETSKLVCFRVLVSRFTELAQPFTSFANFDLLLEYAHSDLLFEHLVAHGKFAGVTQAKVMDAKSGFLFEFRGVNYFNADHVSVKAKCLGPLSFDQVFLYDFSLNQDFLARVEHRPWSVRVHWVEGRAERRTNFELSPAAEQSLACIERRALHFLLKLQQRNANFYDEIVRDHGLAAVDKRLSVDYRADPEKFLNVLLNIVEADVLQLRAAKESASFAHKIDFLRDFFDRTRPSSDPLYVFTHSDESRRDKAIHALLLMLVFCGLCAFFGLIYGDVDPALFLPFQR